jgi:methylthioribose-1-phosphate isomerase
VRTVWLQDGAVCLIDQTRLPDEVVVATCRTPEELANAIRGLRVRGAPAIGIAAAYGLALEAARLGQAPAGDALAALEAAGAHLAAARPTAVNLRWAVARMLAVARRESDATRADRLAAEAGVIAAEDLAANQVIGRLGAELIRPGERVLTHCHTGGLATAGYGTAFGILRWAHEAGKGIHVLACETRPLLQGARLTAWELRECGIPGTLITDNAAGTLMARGEIDRVIVGADRIAANGDVANKIGTYALAVLAHAHGLPFVVAAPTSSIDLTTPTGAAIPIEERSAAEVTHVGDRRIAPEGVAVRNPAFDVTPHRYVSVIVTEAGLAAPPYDRTLPALLTTAART